MPLQESAPAKINLSLLVRGRRVDGYHEIESLVVFADIADTLTLDETQPLSLTVSGPTAQAVGSSGDNLVLRAAHELARRVPGLRTGAFLLDKHLPVAAGIGGGSADAAAALRLLARLNSLPLHDFRMFEAARALGADVPVCLECEPRIMKGAGERLGKVLTLPRLNAVLVNPGVPVATVAVFQALGLEKGTILGGKDHIEINGSVDGSTLLALVGESRNDLEPPARAVEPVVGDVLAALSRQPGCQIARMSGSGATCFGLFSGMADVFAAVRALRKEQRSWWVQPATLGGRQI